MADEGDTSSYTCCMTCGGTFTSTRVGVCVGLPPHTHTHRTPMQVGGMWGGSPFCLTTAVTDSFTFAKLCEAQMLFEPGKMSAPRRSPALTYSQPLGSMAVYSGYCALGPFAFVLPSH